MVTTRKIKLGDLSQQDIILLQIAQRKLQNAGILPKLSNHFLLDLVLGRDWLSALHYPTKPTVYQNTAEIKQLADEIKHELSGLDKIVEEA